MSVASKSPPLLGCIAYAVALVASASASSSFAPETWFHVIGGNASKEGLLADIGERAKVVSTWYNALVEDAKKPVEERKTWTKCGPDENARFRKSGLLGPVSLKYGFGR